MGKIFHNLALKSEGFKKLLIYTEVFLDNIYFKEEGHYFNGFPIYSFRRNLTFKLEQKDEVIKNLKYTWQGLIYKELYSYFFKKEYDLGIFTD